MECLNFKFRELGINNNLYVFSFWLIVFKFVIITMQRYASLTVRAIPTFRYISLLKNLGCNCYNSAICFFTILFCNFAALMTNRYR